MMQSNQTFQTKNIPWFKRWFDSVHYHILYGNHNDREAADFINEMTGWLQPPAGSKMLDVGCGTGRHCKQLASKGFSVTGIDLSSYSIREAKKWETPYLQFRRHDMRIPFGFNQFDYAFNLFTSFGFFKTEQENNSVIRNISDALKRQGRLVLDYMNAYFVNEHLVPAEEKEIDGFIYHITRWTDEKFFYKKITIDEGQSGEPFENVEQVARFGLDDFTRMFSQNNLQIEEIFGDHQLNPFDINASPRFIAVVKKTG